MSNLRPEKTQKIPLLNRGMDKEKVARPILDPHARSQEMQPARLNNASESFVGVIPYVPEAKVQEESILHLHNGVP